MGCLQLYYITVHFKQPPTTEDITFCVESNKTITIYQVWFGAYYALLLFCPQVRMTYHTPHQNSHFITNHASCQEYKVSNYRIARNIGSELNLVDWQFWKQIVGVVSFVILFVWSVRQPCSMHTLKRSRFSCHIANYHE